MVVRLIDGPAVREQEEIKRAIGLTPRSEWRRLLSRECEGKGSGLVAEPRVFAGRLTCRRGDPRHCAMR
jgi:hypothetical protein